MNNNKFQKQKEETVIIKEATALTASTYAFQIILMIRGFIIARVLGPSLYGFWSLLRTFFNGAAFLGLGLNNAMERQVPLNVARGKSEKNFSLQQNSLTWSLILSMLILVVVLIVSFTEIITEFKNEMRLAGLVFILNTIHIFIPSKLKSEKKIILLSKYFLAYAILNTILGLSLLFAFKIQGLLIGLALTIMILIIYLLKSQDFSFRLRLDRKVLKSLFKIGFPIMIVSSSFFLMRNIEKFIVFVILGSTKTGYYGLASFLSATINHIPLAVSTVLFPRMLHKYGRTNDIKQIEEYYTQPILLLSGLVPIILGLVFININIPIVYLLPQYIPSIKVLQILVMGSFFFAICDMPRNILITFGKQKILMYCVLILLMLVAILDVVIIKMGFGIMGVAFGSAFMFLLVSLMTNIYVLFSLKKNIKEVIFTILKIYAPFLYSGCGLIGISLVDIPDKLILTDAIQTVLFLIYSLPLILYVNKHSGIVSKISVAFRLHRTEDIESGV